MGLKEAGVVFKRLWPEIYYGTRRFPLHYVFEIGDKCRITLNRQPLKHSFYGLYSEEIFTVIERFPRDPVVYRLADAEGHPVRGLFTRNELTKVRLE